MSINTLPTEPVHVTTLNEYQKVSSQTAIYPGQGTPVGLAYVALKMNGEAGEFAEHVGKAMRDEGLMDGVLDPFRRELLIKEIGDVLWYLGAASRELGIKLEDVANLNIQKLQDRQRRNILQGSGDER